MKRKAEVSAVRPSLESFLSDGVRDRLKQLPELKQAIMERNDEKALHGLRVASRRLRAAIALMRSFVPVRQLKPAARRVKEITRILRVSRELDVHAEDLMAMREAAPSTADRAVLEYLAERLDERRRAEQRVALEALRRISISHLQKSFKTLIRLLRHTHIPQPTRLADDLLSPLVERAFAGLPALRHMQRPDELHRTRIAIKRLRYALEWLKPLAPRGIAGIIRKLVKLQDCLGRHHDAQQLLLFLADMERELSRRGRTTLAAGTRTCWEDVARERDGRYAEFLELTDKISASSVHADIKRSLSGGTRNMPQRTARVRRPTSRAAG